MIFFLRRFYIKCIFFLLFLYHYNVFREKNEEIPYINKMIFRVSSIYFIHYFRIIKTFALEQIFNFKFLLWKSFHPQFNEFFHAILEVLFYCFQKTYAIDIYFFEFLHFCKSKLLVKLSRLYAAALNEELFEYNFFFFFK